ncbi:MAG: hypothetical protein WC801_02950 [Patescibacteria group bacterium]|jgi:hypothetical protein
MSTPLTKIVEIFDTLTPEQQNTLLNISETIEGIDGAGRMIRKRDVGNILTQATGGTPEEGDVRPAISLEELIYETFAPEIRNQFLAWTAMNETWKHQGLSEETIKKFRDARDDDEDVDEPPLLDRLYQGINEALNLWGGLLNKSELIELMQKMFNEAEPKTGEHVDITTGFSEYQAEIQKKEQSETVQEPDEQAEPAVPSMVSEINSKRR